jgi:hypothetical protein
MERKRDSRMVAMAFSSLAALEKVIVMGVCGRGRRDGNKKG